jgi:hypothetical protein
MHVIGHQDVGVEFAFGFTERLTYPVQVPEVVLFAEEEGFAVVPALHDVQRHAIKVNAGAAGHECMLARKYIEPGPFNPMGDWRDSDRSQCIEETDVMKKLGTGAVSEST